MALYDLICRDSLEGANFCPECILPLRQDSEIPRQLRVFANKITRVHACIKVNSFTRNFPQHNSVMH
jgi:hypothetical protein